MKIHLLRLAVLLWAPSWFRRAPPSRTRSARVDVAERDGAIEVAIQGTRPPSYTVFKLQDPPRLVVDLAGADVSKLASPLAVKKGGVAEITTAQYQDERSSVGRVIVALDAARPYEVDAAGRCRGGAGARAEGAKPPPAAPRAASRISRGRSPRRSAPSRPVDPERSAAEPRRTAAAPSPRTTTSSPAAWTRAARARARTLRAVRSGKDGIVLSTDGEVGKIEIIELRDPSRLVLDLHGVSRAPKGTVKLSGAFTQVRFGKDDGKIRAVLDAAGELPKYEVKRVAGGVAIVAQAAGAKAAATPKARPRSPSVAPSPARRGQTTRPDRDSRPEAGRPERSDRRQPRTVEGPRPSATAKPRPRPHRRRPLRPAGQGRPHRDRRQGALHALPPRRAHRGPLAGGRGDPEEARALARHERVPGPGAHGLLLQPALHRPGEGGRDAARRGEGRDRRDEGRPRLDVRRHREGSPGVAAAPVARGRATEAQAAGFAAEAPGVRALRRAAGARLHRPPHHPRLPRHRHPQPPAAHRRRLEEEHRRRRRRDREGDRLPPERALGSGARPRPQDEGARQGGDGERHPDREVRGHREGAAGARRGGEGPHAAHPAQGPASSRSTSRAPATSRAA